MKHAELLRLINEGGAVGHLQHLYENRDMTFAELKEILTTAAEGRLEKVSEKLDGMNCVFTWNAAAGELKVARSGGDIKRGGMDAGQLADKFKDRGNLTDAFNSAFKVLSDAIATLSDDDKVEVFGPSANFWYSVEIIYTANPNVVNYDGNAVVFHGWPVFEADEAGNVSKGENENGVQLLTANVTRMQKAVTMRNWQVRGPAIVNLQKLSDGSIVQEAAARISRAQQDAGVDDSSTINDYLTSLMSEEVADLGLPEDVAQMVVGRALANPGAPTLTAIKKVVSKEQYPAVNDFVKGAPILLKRFIAPIEAAVQSFAVALLTGLRSSLVGSHDEEVARLRQAVTSAVSAIKSSGNEAAMDVLNRQMQKLGSVENITTPVEGVVFIWKGNAYKFTGSFAAANQILGLFKYGRGKAPPLGEAQLRQVVDELRATCVTEVNDDLIEGYPRSLVNEMSLGSDIRDEEESARWAYQAALAELDKWGVEYRKKEAFLQACKELGIGPDSLKARGLKIREPEKYSYDPKVLQTSVVSIKSRVASARRKLANYDPTAIDFEELAPKSPPKERDSGVHLKMPKTRKKVYMRVDKLEPLQFYSWDDKRWASAVKNVPLGFGSGKMTGHPGEERLGVILGGEVQDDNVSFDIVTPNGWRWEVKGVKEPGDDIRPGAQGQAAYAAAEKVLIELCEEMSDFAEEVDGTINDITTTVEQRGMFYVIVRFVEEDVPKIKGGEISRERFVRLRRALKAAALLKKTWRAEVGNKPDEVLHILGKDVSLSREKYIDVANKVHAHNPEADVLSVVDARERALQMLWSDAFNEPDTWMDRWDASIDVKKIFADVAGVFVVTPRGFYKVPRKMIDNVFKFLRITQGLPRYGVNL